MKKISVRGRRNGRPKKDPRYPPVASEAVRGLPSSADNERLEAINRMAKTQLEDGTYDKVILPEGAEDE